MNPNSLSKVVTMMTKKVKGLSSRCVVIVGALFRISHGPFSAGVSIQSASQEHVPLFIGQVLEEGQKEGYLWIHLLT